MEVSFTKKGCKKNPAAPYKKKTAGFEAACGPLRSFTLLAYGDLNRSAHSSISVFHHQRPVCALVPCILISGPLHIGLSCYVNGTSSALSSTFSQSPPILPFFPPIFCPSVLHYTSATNTVKENMPQHEAGTMAGKESMAYRPQISYSMRRFKIRLSI